MKKGIFISFEGPDGVGKTTQIGLLAEKLKQQGSAVICTREPGGTPIGDKIRHVLLDPENSGISSRAEALLYMAARAQHVAEVIKPAIEAGQVVLTDRFSDSTLVYQGLARGLNCTELTVINDFAAMGVSPKFTILLDTDPAAMTDRLKQRGNLDRLELESTDFHDKVRQGFLSLAAQEPERILLIDAARSIDEIHAEIWLLVNSYLRRTQGED